MNDVLLPSHNLSLPAQLPRALMRGAFRLIFGACGGLTVSGTENVPVSGPVLFCPNHISDSDPAALFTVLPRHDVYFMGKQELFKIPFMRHVFKYYGGFPVVRDSADRKALHKAESILKAGRGLVIYPEGRIATDQRMRRLQPGAAMVALKAGAPIVPVAISGTNAILVYGTLVPRRAKQPAHIAFGKPILPSEFEGMGRREALDAVTARLRDELVAMGIVARSADEPTEDA